MNLGGLVISKFVEDFFDSQTRSHLRGLGMFVILLVVAGVGTLALAFPAIQKGMPEQEIILVASDMVFFLPGKREEKNPTLRFKPGTKVTLTLQNVDPGMRHDFRIEGLAVQTGLLSNGQSEVVTFTLPSQKGVYTYLCTVHPISMRGQIVVD